MWHCGMRISEVLDLRVQDVDLSGRKLFIECGKKSKDRVIYISETTAAALGEHLPTAGIRTRPTRSPAATGR